ncbi:MAG: CaiB/BaiF CoA-transferase family protein [Pseudomonadota bacterium]
MRPFEGIRCLDLTHVLAGPFSTFQLAVLGADVIKIEPPQNPDMTREEGAVRSLNEEDYGTLYLGQNGGKRAITLDLKTEKGRDILRKLVAGADVLVENYRAGKMAELGLGYEDLTAVNPKLIYCSLTGFGQTGPKARHPAYDVVIQAYSGLMVANGEANSAPVRVGPPMVDYGTGAQAALAISAALYQRGQTGKGQRIDVSMLDGALMLMSSQVTSTLCTGSSPAAHGNAHPDYAGYSTYETMDGLLMIGAHTTRQAADIFHAIGDSTLGEEVAAMSRDELRAARDRLAEMLTQVLLTRTAQEWEDILNDGGVPAARVRRLDETLASEHIASRSVLQTIDGPGGPDETRRLAVAAYSFAHGGPRLDRPPPRVGEHTEEVLAELGLEAEEIADLKSRGIV